MKKILFTLTVLLLVVAFGVSAFMVGNYLLEGKRQEDQMKDLANQISQAQSEAADEAGDGPCPGHRAQGNQGSQRHASRL